MIPEELKSYPQWVLWREDIKPDGTRTKIPYSVYGGRAATDNPQTWTTFEIASESAQRLMMGIGFVLTVNDPFAFIDLDDPRKNHPTEEQAQIIIARHRKIIESFDSYTEVSPSGNGLHIIVKAEGVTEGKRRDNVEVYTSNRYMTMTGNTYKQLPIQERNYLTHQLWLECGGNTNGKQETIITEQAEQYTDEQIYYQAKDAKNGEKFLALWQGHWVDAAYKSHSEADLALINILSFYSRNVAQIKRMFALSGLHDRSKAKRKTYVDEMIRKSFDNQPPEIPFEAIKESVQKQLDEKKPAPVVVSNPFAGPLFENVQSDSLEWTTPPGLLGEIANFVYDASPRPVREIALAASIGMMSGICGRAYNVSHTGLNQYILLLARTGRGKEAIAQGISRLMGFVKLVCPAAMQFIGPSEIASGQALVKYLATNPCFVSIVGEFGVSLQGMCAHNANPAQTMLRKKMLELYSKSGEKDVLQSTIYSNKTENVPTVQSPAFSILGESVAESYYDALDETMISQGLLPRFMIIEYPGKRVGFNKHHYKVVPSRQLVDAVAQLCENCLIMSQNNRTLHIEIDAEAEKFSDEFNETTDEAINRSEVVIAQELWNRAHLKLLKLAGLIAVGLNPYQPIVTLEAMKWAKILVERDVQSVFNRFEEGKIGKATNEGHQIDAAITVVRDYLQSPYDLKMQKYAVDSRMHADRCISLSYLQRRLQQLAAFRHDRMGSTIAIKRAVEALISDGALREVRQLDIYNRYGKTMKAYVVTDVPRFLDIGS